MKNIYKKVKSKYKNYGFINLMILILKYPYIRLKWILALKDNTGEVFKTIYDNSLWSSPESKSGEGSEKNYTQNLRMWMIENIPKYEIRNIVDAPCGDFNWMRYVLPDVSVNYIGLDIVEELIKINNKKYSCSDITFKKSNIIEERIPDCDLLIVRDCLFHFSYADINQFLKNIKKTNYKYLLTTSHIVSSDFKNFDIKTGDFRKIDLFKSPFNFSENSILECINDYPEGHRTPKSLSLIQKEFVPTNISNSRNAND